MWIQIIFGVGLIGLSLILVRMHRLERSANAFEANRGRVGPTDRSRYQRRMLASALFGIVGVLLLCEPLLRHPLVLAIYWSIALLVVLAIIALGSLDFVRSRRYVTELKAQHKIERAALEAEITAHFRRRAETTARPPDPPPASE